MQIFPHSFRICTNFQTTCARSCYTIESKTKVTYRLLAYRTSTASGYPSAVAWSGLNLCSFLRTACPIRRSRRRTPLSPVDTLDPASLISHNKIPRNLTLNPAYEKHQMHFKKTRSSLVNSPRLRTNTHLIGCVGGNSVIAMSLAALYATKEFSAASLRSAPVANSAK